MLKKLLPILVLLLISPFSGHAQTSITGTVIEGPFSVRPAACAPGDLFFAIDTFVLYQCGPTNTWSTIAGGQFGYSSASSTSSITLSSAGNAFFDFTLSGNVTSMSVASVGQIPGTIYGVQFCQPSVGGPFTVSWPTVFNSPPLVFTGASQCTSALFKLNGFGTWDNITLNSYYQTVQVNGSIFTQRPSVNFLASCISGTDNSGSNRTDITFSCGTPSGSPGTIQAAGPSGTLQSTNLFESGTQLIISEDVNIKGPNPYVDVRSYGAVALNTSTTPYTAGITASCTSGNPAVPISSASTFVNKQGVVLYGCGATHSMSTPSAPTATSILAAGPPGSGYVVSAPAGGSETTCYVIVARDKGQGITAKSGETCVTGQTRGQTIVNLTSCARSANTLVTCTTASPHVLVTGAKIRISGTTLDTEYAGWFIINTVPDNTHFTYQGLRDTRAGASTIAATGGSVKYWVGNHISIGVPGTGVYQYAVYRGSTGAETLMDVSTLVNATLNLDSSYMTVDDFGTTYTTVPNLPGFWPNTPPASAVPDSLVTTISSGGGTTTLTLANTPSNNTSGSSIRADNAPNILAAYTAAQINHGMILWPQSGTASVWATNSVLDLSSLGNIGTSIAGTPFIGDTMLTNGTFHCDLAPGTLQTISFALNQHNPILINAKPGISMSQGTWTGCGFIPQGTNANSVYINGGNIPTAQFYNNEFRGSSSAADYQTIPLYMFTQGNAGNQAAGVNLRDNNFSGQANGATPSLMSKNLGEIVIDGFFGNQRGFYFSICPTCTGANVSVQNKYETQSSIIPLITTRGTIALVANGMIEDTGSEPIIAHEGGGQLTIAIGLDGLGLPSNSMPQITGSPTVKSVTGANVSDSQMGININYAGQVSGIIDDGVYNTTQALFIRNTHQSIGPNYSLFTSGGTFPAPTCNVVSAGPPFSMSANGANTYTFAYSPIYPNGGLGLNSARVSCAMDGTTQQATITVPSVVNGAVGYQLFWGTGGGLGNEVSTSFTTLAMLVPSCVSGCQGFSSPQFAGGGPAGIQNSQIWGDFFPNAPNNTANALPSFTGGKLIATPCVPVTAGSLCDWNGANWSLFAGNTTTQSIFEESAAGTPVWVTAPLGSLVGTGQSNTFTTGVQDFSAVTEFRPKSGLTAALPATCTGPTPMDVYVATDATAGQNWYFCTATNTWTQQLNSGTYALNTYSSSHTLLANEQWANFSATATATVPHAILNHRWVVFNTSSSNTVTIAPDSGNVTLNGVTATTASIGPGLGVQIACDGANCFAWGIGSSGGGGSGTVSSGTVNGPAYYTALTTVGSVTPPTTPNGVPSTLTSTPSGGVSQPPTLSLPGIAGRAVSGIASTDTILSTDCNPNRVEYIGSVAVAVTLPTATTLGVPKCVFKLVNTTSPAQTVTITPTTWTINGNTTLQLGFGQKLTVYVDPNSATNWVADQDDLVGAINGSSVPASAKLLGTNSNAQIIAAALSNTHIYVGNGSNLPVDVAVSGDAAIANTGSVTVTGVNGAVVPASANVVGTNSSRQIVSATAHNIVLPWQCADSSGSGSAQVCNTSPTFTPVAGDAVIYTTTTANTGTALTINVNSLGAKSVAKWQTSTTLAANDIRANTEVLLTYDGTNWELTTIGNAPAGGGSTTPCNVTNLSLQYDNSNTFGCVTEFTYASSTITVSATGKLDMTSASVTAGFHLPSAASAAPTNGGILSYDTTNNRFVGGNAVNTSFFPWFTSAPTASGIVGWSGTLGLQTTITALPNATTATTQSAGDNTTDVATDAFVTTAVNNAIAAVNPAVAVLAATTGSNLTGTYSNGVSGVGATFTITATGAFTLDGVAINTLGQRVLIKDQSSAFQNGVYTATVIGTTGVSAVFTRAIDYDQPSDINSTGSIPVQSGTVNASTSWLLTSTVNTVGTDALTYTQFSIAPTSIVTAAATLTNNQAINGTGSKGAAAGFSDTAGTITSGHLACFTSSGTIGNCTGLSGILGVFNSSTTWIASGETSIVLDATVNVTAGDNLCASPTSINTAHDNGSTACTTGLSIGIVKTTASSVSSATAFVALR